MLCVSLISQFVSHIRTQTLAPALVLISASVMSGSLQAQTSIGPVTATAPVVEGFQAVASDSRVRAMLERIAENEPETLAEQVRLTQIPAPPFQEQERAQYYLQQMRSRRSPRYGFPSRDRCDRADA